MQSPGRISIGNLYKTLIALNSRRGKTPQFHLFCTGATTPNNINGVSIGTHHVDNSSNIKSNWNKPRMNKGKQEETLYSKIIHLGNTSVDVASLIDQWVEDGNEVHFTVLQRIIHELRKLSRFSHALQVSKWMKHNGAFTFSPVEHAVHIILIGKVYGHRYAEIYFNNNLSEADKTEKTYEALLHCYVRQRYTIKVFSHLQVMKEKGLKLSSFVYNEIMTLYTLTGKLTKVPGVLTQMKENGVSPDFMSYKICLNSYCQRSDITGMEMLLDEIEHQPHIFVDQSTRALIVNLYNKKGLSAKANDFLKRAKARPPIETKINYKEALYSNIIPLGNKSVNIASLFDQWVKHGNKVQFAELLDIVIDLRKRSRFSQALQVSKWMKDYEAFTLSPAYHVIHIDLIGMVHGSLSAETYFNNLSEADKTEKAYGALLHCYVRNRDTLKAFSHMDIMKEKGLQLSSVVYNDIMNLFIRTGEYEMVPGVLYLMKENGVSPDNMSYNICLNSYGQRSDIKGMEKLLNEMECLDWTTCTLVANLYSRAGFSSKANDYLKVAESRLPIEEKPANDGYNHLISLHATLGNKSEVLRLWRCEKMRVDRDYINMLGNLMRMNEFEEVEKVLEEWKNTPGNQYVTRIPYIVIDKYIEKGECVKAEKILKDLMKRKGKLPDPDRWGRVAIRHLELGNTTRAVECMKTAVSLGIENKWKAEFRVMSRLIDVIGVEEENKAIRTGLDTRPEKTMAAAAATEMNFDVIGVVEENKVIRTGLNTQPEKTMAAAAATATEMNIEKNNRVFKFDLTFQ